MGLSQEKLERLSARSTDIVVAAERNGNVVYYNDGVSRILGYSQGEILGAYVGGTARGICIDVWCHQDGA